MFSWSKKSDSKKRPKRRGGSAGPALNEFGIPINQQSGNDEELEAELRALTGGVISIEEDLEVNEEGSDVEAEFERMFAESKGKKKTKTKAVKESAADSVKDTDVTVNIDVTNVDDGDAEDDDLEVDENDPELLGELMGLTEADEEEEEEEEEEEPQETEPKKQPVTITSLLTERLNMYKAAEAKAKENKESSRARRFARGIKTLQQLIKKAEAGQPVLPSEIPPVIATNLKPAPPPILGSNIANEELVQVPTIEVTQKITGPGNDVPSEEISNLTVDENVQEEDEGRYEKKARQPLPEEEEVEKPTEAPPPTVENPWLPMLRSRRDEYKTSALTAKRNNDLDTALRHVKCVKVLSALIAAAEAGEEIQDSEIPPSLSQPPARKPVEIMKPLKFEAPEECDDYGIPTTVLEALNQRLRIYQGFQREAQQNGDEAGMKRNGKVVEVYREAIKCHKAGRKVPLLKLPTPPGCPPIPIPFEVD